MPGVPLSARLYFAVLTVSVVGLMMALLGLAAPLDQSTLGQAAAVAALLMVAWLYPLSLSFKQQLYLDTSVLVAAIVLLPPGLVMVVAGAGTLFAHLIRRQDWVQSTFNAAQMMAQAGIGGLILAAFDNRIPHRPEAVGYVLLAGMAMFVCNNLLVATMVAFQSRTSPVSLWRQASVEVSGVELTGHILQIGVGALSIFLLKSAPWSLPLLFVPTIATYVAFRTWIRRRQETEAKRHAGDAGPIQAQRVALVGNWQWNLRTGDIIWSEEIYRLLGLSREASKSSYEALLRSIHPEDRVAVNRAVHNALRSGGAFHVNHRVVLPDGSQRNLEQRGEVILGAVGGGRLVATMKDVTERKSLEAQLAQQALRDPDTGLPNRAFALDHVAELLASRPSDQGPVAVVMVEVEDMRAMRPHPVGQDGILLEMARRLRVCSREGEMVARFGVRRFMVVLEASTADVATARAVDIRDILRVPLDYDGHAIIPAVNVGAAVSSSVVQLPQDLVRAAEAALEREKANAHLGPKKILVHEPNGVFVTETELRAALDRGELRLFYQPEVKLTTGEIVGFEAQIRWRHPTRAWLLPGDFLPVAEACGLDLAIGYWVLEVACHTACEWPVPATSDHPLTISVNITPRHFRESRFVSDVKSVLDSASLDPARLRLELRESIVVEDLDASNRTMVALRDLGVRFTIDDFGAGYTSLGYLHRLPIDALKLDRSLIAALEIGDADRAIVRTTASLARAFGLDVSAMGIETPVQLAWADALGCGQGQGYFFSPPLDGEQLNRFLKRAASFGDFAPVTHIATASAAS